MPLFAFQRVPARQNAHAVRGSDNLVTLQSAAQDGIHRALAALTIVDPHDPSKRVIPAYFIEGCYLRALRTQEGEPAFDSAFPTGSLIVEYGRDGEGRNSAHCEQLRLFTCTT